MGNRKGPILVDVKIKKHMKFKVGAAGGNTKEKNGWWILEKGMNKVAIHVKEILRERGVLEPF